MQIKDKFKPGSNVWELCESGPNEPSFDREIYLARLQGPMALYDGESLNGRYYSRGLWESAFRNSPVSEGMFGTIGHDVPMDEETLSDGKVSHKITKLWLNEKTKTVDGEILILNSSSGRELNTLLRSGMKISVSSRAYGNFNGKTSSGADIIDESTFHLQGFDFVTNPGVEVARPRLVEEKPQLHEERKMEKELLESLNERSKLQVELSESIKKQIKAEQDLSESQKANEKLQKELNEAKARLSWFAKTLGPKPIATLKELNEGIGKWLVVPEFQEIAKEFGKFDNGGATFAETVKKLLESVKGYAALGTKAKIEESLKEYQEFKKLGSSPAKLSAALDLLEAYVKLGHGKPEELKAVLNEAVKARDALKKARKVVAARVICTENNLKPEEHGTIIVEMFDKGFTPEEVKANLAKLQKLNESAKPAAQTRKPAAKTEPTTSVKKSTVVPTTRIDESVDASVNSALKLVKMPKYNPVTTTK